MCPNRLGAGRVAAMVAGTGYAYNFYRNMDQRVQFDFAVCTEERVIMRMKSFPGRQIIDILSIEE